MSDSPHQVRREADAAVANAEAPQWIPPLLRATTAASAVDVPQIAQWMARRGFEPADYFGAHRWSIEHIEEFWSDVWDLLPPVAAPPTPPSAPLSSAPQAASTPLTSSDALFGAGGGVIGDKGAKPYYVPCPVGTLHGARFFPNARVNYAENLLREPDDRLAILFRDERGRNSRWSRREVYQMVGRWRQALQSVGVVEGDRVCAMLPNIPQAVFAFLATNSIGAVWSSASPDFGVQGVLDRFAQIEPKVLITVDGYYYGGKPQPIMQNKVRAIVKGLSRTLRSVVVIPFLREVLQPTSRMLRRRTPSPDRAPGANRTSSSAPPPNPAATQHQLIMSSGGYGGGCTTLSESDFISPFEPLDVIPFNRLPFDHPLYVLFSSGTTGKPKCIVHGQGGSLLQHLKEHVFHCDVRPSPPLPKAGPFGPTTAPLQPSRPSDRVFYFTTLGWMMWNWLVSAIAVPGAAIMLFDGNPFHPSPDVLWQFANENCCTLFGTSAKYIDALRQAKYSPGSKFALTTVRTICSTGSPLVHESFDFVRQHIKADAHLASISGGTDIVSCFVLGVPTLPVYRGQLQAPGLGMAVTVFNDDGEAVKDHSMAGELVCTAPFPSKPIGFWGDDKAHTKYRAAYFKRYGDAIWHHGDWMERTPQGGFIISGRSDATLNPGGVRIGTAEIYRQVEQILEVAESLAVGQDVPGDVRVILFVVLKKGVGEGKLTAELKQRIAKKIREGASPRHVPAVVVEVPDIPRTKSGKITETAVREVIHNRPVKNIEALANPEALNHYRNRPELALATSPPKASSKM
jgi:acetoacetyl-CoA synthetase